MWACENLAACYSELCVTPKLLLERVLDFKARQPKRFDFLKAFAAGLAAWLALALLPLQTLEAVQRGADDAADRMMRLSSFTTANLDRTAEFAIFDVDEASWQDWGQPLVLPRDKLANLVAVAVGLKARAIVLDVDLAYPDKDERERALSDFLRQYPKGAPPLLLVRSLTAASDGGPARYPSQRQTPYDEPVARAVAAGARITWATPLFEADRDGLIRRWRLFEIVCDAGTASVVPSLPLAVADLVRRKSGAAGASAADALQGELKPLLPRECASPAATARPVAIAATAGAPEIVLNGSDQSQRVIYRIPWRPNEPSLGPRTGNDPPLNLVEVRSARAVLAAPPGALARLEGRFVLIGGSFAAGGDIHPTPIGAMPGVVVLANAMHALVYSGTPRAPKPWQSAVITLAVLTIAAAATAFLRPSVAAVATACGVLLIQVLALPIFRSGAVLSLAVPALGAVFHETIEAWVKTLESIREQRWRWALRTPAKDAKPPQDTAKTEEGLHS